MLDHRDEVESDFSVLHRERYPFRLGAPRFFRLVGHLKSYDGAVRYARARDDTPLVGGVPSPVQSAAAVPPAEDLPDITSIVALSQQPGFPSIAYTSGG